MTEVKGPTFYISIIRPDGTRTSRAVQSLTEDQLRHALGILTYEWIRRENAKAKGGRKQRVA